MPGLVGVSAELTAAQVRLRARGDPRLPVHLAADHAAGQPGRGARRLALRHLDDGLPRQQRRPRHLPAATGRLTAVKVDYDANRLAEAPPVGALVSRDFTDLPTGLDPIVQQLADAGHRRGVDPLREGGGAAAVVPRPTGRLQYSTDVDLGNGTDDLVRFLSRGRRRPHRLLRAVRRGDGGHGPRARHPGPRRGRLPRARARSATTPRSTAPTTCTPGPSCSSPARAGCGSSPRRRPGPAAFPTTPSKRSPSAPRPTTPSRDRRQPPTTCRRRESERRRSRRSRRGPGSRPVRRRRLPRGCGWPAALVLMLVLAAGRARPADRAPAPPRPARTARPRGGLGGAARHRARPAAAVAAVPLARGRPARRWSSCSAPRATSSPPSGPAAARTPTRTPSSRSTGSCTRSSGSATPAHDGSRARHLARRDADLRRGAVRRRPQARPPRRRLVAALGVQPPASTSAVRRRRTGEPRGRPSRAVARGSASARPTGRLSAGSCGRGVAATGALVRPPQPLPRTLATHR